MNLITRAAVCGALIAAPGCTQWQWVRPAAVPSDAPLRISEARVTRPDGSMMELRQVEVTADSVTGRRIARPGAGERVALHRREVVLVERLSVSFLRTALVAAAAVAFALYVLVSKANAAA